ncbi:MAG: transketolase [Hirschia sp.]|nr:transketolase [Hirschia sp.]MBF17599.1 transketolase [Hirschia sp.]
MTTSNITNRDMANAIRALSMDAVEKAKSGHVGLPLGMADAATVLFTRFLKFDPKAPDWADRDRFVLSAGHGSMLIYALLHLTGYDSVSMDDIRNFRQLGSNTPGHPENFITPGVETTTGPLGQGIATAVGMAMAERFMNANYGDDLVDHYTYVIAGDGCLMEGISQEAITLAGYQKLGKLIVLFDDNEVTIDGGINLTDCTKQTARFASSGWQVEEVDGHDPEAVAAAIEKAKADPRPSMIACRTTIGFGAPTIAGTGKAHGGPYGADEIEGIRKNIGWPHAPFVVPDDVLSAWRKAGTRSSDIRAQWEARVSGSDQAADFKRAIAGELPTGSDEAIIAHKKAVAEGGETKATRQWSGAALEVLTGLVPEMVGGSADLTGSNNTKTSHTPPMTPDAPAGRYVHYGVREHAMAAAMNGMSLHGGVIPYSGTFLAFADYSRPAIRLGALMQTRVIHVMTHDSIGLGEDGPTHQPVEQVASLRAMPNLMVFRPADGVETAECWQMALSFDKTPSVIALTRQGVPSVRSTHVVENLCAKGGYVLKDADNAQIVLIGTGSELSLALEAQSKLADQGIAARVVSMPCFELFDAQSDAYKEEVLGGSLPKVAVEAGIRFGWDQYVGSDGGFVGMNGFGASAPYKDLYQHFGITAEAVVDAALKRV